MISLIEGYYDYSYNQTSASTAKVTSANKTTDSSQTAKEAAATVATSISNTDTLELSSTYAAQVATTTVAIEETDTTNDDASTLIMSGAPAEPINQEAATVTEEDTTEATDLSTYSETQLRALVKEGTISRQEMNEELARRVAEAASESADVNSDEEVDEADVDHAIQSIQTQALDQTVKQIDDQVDKQIENQSEEQTDKLLSSYQKQGVQTYIEQANYSSSVVANGSVLSIA